MRRLAALWLLGLACVAGIGCGPKKRSLDSGPYVQSVTSSSVIVAAVTEDSLRLRLRLGPAGGERDRTVEEPETVLVHGLQVTGLAPGTRYDYQLETVEGESIGAGTIHTAPPGREAPCRFLVVGDSGGTKGDRDEFVGVVADAYESVKGTGGDKQQQETVVGAMLGRDADLVLHLGDVVYPAGAREDYKEGFFEPFSPLIRDVPLYPTLGNHDVKTEGGAPFLEVFFVPEGGPTEDHRAYAFDWGCVHFVCLDVVSTPFEEGSPQLLWLAESLAQSKAAWKVVFFHYPIFSPTRVAPQELEKNLSPVLEGGGADLVLSGHDHAYARFVPRGSSTYIVSGGGGKDLYVVKGRADMVYGESVFHFLDVSGTRGEMAVHAVDARGRVFDEVTLRK